MNQSSQSTLDKKRINRHQQVPLCVLMRQAGKNMFQAVVQFRDPHQPQHIQHQPVTSNQKPPVHPQSGSSSDSGGGGQSATLPNRRSRRRKSLLYQVLMSPLRKKSGSTNTLNTVGSGGSDGQQRQQNPGVSC